MEVSVQHVDSGRNCVVGVPDGGTVISLKVDALKEMFAGSSNVVRKAAGLVARIEGCEEELDDAECVAETGLEGGGAVHLVRRWPHVKAPAVYISGHCEMAYNAVLSRCGTLCSVGYQRGCIAVFDTTTAVEVADLTLGEEKIHCTAFSVCGRWLATCSRDNTLCCVWETSTWGPVQYLKHGTGVGSAAWTHCGRLVSGSQDGKVYVWDLEGTPSATVLEGHVNMVNGIAVSKTRVFTGSTDFTIRVYDLGTLTHTDTLCEHTDEVRSIALTNDGLLSCSEDEQHMVSFSYDNSVKVWCTTTLSCLRTLRLQNDVHCVAMSEPGDVLVSYEESCNLTELFNLSTLQCLGKVDVDGLIVALSPCGRWVFIRGHGSVRVRALCDVTREGGP